MTRHFPALITRQPGSFPDLLARMHVSDRTIWLARQLSQAWWCVVDVFSRWPYAYFSPRPDVLHTQGCGNKTDGLDD